MSGSIKINDLSSGREAANEIKAAAQLLDVQRTTAASGFNALTQVTPDLGSKFISELTTSLDDIYNFLNGKLYSAIEGYFKDDNEEETPKGKNPSGGGPSGVGPAATSTDPPKETTPETTPDTTPDTVPDTTPEESVIPGGVELSKIDTESLEEVKLDELNGTVQELIDLSKSKSKLLDELLGTDEESDNIKKLLLESPNIPEEFKNVIKDLDSRTVRLLLKYILHGNSPEIFDLNTLNLGVMYSYLEGVAKTNGLTMEQLLTDSKNTGLLRSALQECDNVVELIKGWEDLSSEEFQEQLKEFYYGDVSEEFPDSDITVTRAYVDFLAEECDVYYEDFLKDSSYAETLKEGAVQLGKSLTFFKAASFFTDDGMRNTVTSMFDGTNSKAFGMNEDSVTKFKAEIDAAAKENNTTADKLLSDSQYADKVKETLAKSSSAKGVGSIYRESDSTTSQKVAKNLYNTDFTKKSDEQIELEKYAEEAAKALEEQKKVAETVPPTAPTTSGEGK